MVTSQQPLIHSALSPSFSSRTSKSLSLGACWRSINHHFDHQYSLKRRKDKSHLTQTTRTLATNMVPRVLLHIFIVGAQMDETQAKYEYIGPTWHTGESWGHLATTPGRPASNFGQMASDWRHPDTYILLHAKKHSNVQHATIGSRRAMIQEPRRFHLVLSLRLVTSSIQTPHHSTNERKTSGMAVERTESEGIRGRPTSFSTWQRPNRHQGMI